MRSSQSRRCLAGISGWIKQGRLLFGGATMRRGQGYKRAGSCGWHASAACAAGGKGTTKKTGGELAGLRDAKRDGTQGVQSRSDGE